MRHSVAIAERHADGQDGDYALWRAYLQTNAGLQVADFLSEEAVICGLSDIEEPIEYLRLSLLPLARELNVQPATVVGWMDCLLGSAEIKESARSPTVFSLASTINETQCWDRAPILADALEEAGMTDTTALEHLRCDRHLLGCHVIDAVLR